MERFNPFSSDLEPDPFTTSFNRSSEALIAKTSQETASKSNPDQAAAASTEIAAPPVSSSQPAAERSGAGRYTTSFPDPFGDSPMELPPASPTGAIAIATSISERPATQTLARATTSTSASTNRSNSVTFAPVSHSVDDSPTSTGAPERRPRQRTGEAAGGSGFTSFLSRATSVTSSTVTDRVSGAVGSVRSAVDSISSQLQQAVPANITSTATSLIGGGGGGGGDSTPPPQQQQLSAASYLASKLSSATGQFTSGGQSPNSMPVISRQRVVLILDSLAESDWPLQFTNQRRIMAGLAPLTQSSPNQSSLSSFFSQATSSGSSGGSCSLLGANLADADLIEQVDFRNVSILANQSSSTATVFVGPPSSQQLDLAQQQQRQQQPQNQPLIRTSSQSVPARSPVRDQQQQQPNGVRIIRPEYVVVRQRARDWNEARRLGSIVKALNYCLVPMFEPIEAWSCFQDRQLLFSRLLRLQRHLGRENFPLIPQLYCQTHQDLLNYINGSAVVYLPCLVRIGSTGQGKIRIDNQQMFRDFATIMATSGLSCTIEPFLEVKCDLVIQKFGTNLKSFKRSVKKQQQPYHDSRNNMTFDETGKRPLMSEGSFGADAAATSQAKQSAFRQTSLGSSVLSSLITSSTGQQQQQQQSVARRSSNSSLAYEKVTEVNVRYKTWLEAIAKEFDYKIEAFCIKVIVASNDREYIVGLHDCGLDFLGTLDNQDEDKRSFVELIISSMNTNLPKHSSVSRETSISLAGGAQQQSQVDSGGQVSDLLRRSTSDDKASKHTAADQEVESISNLDRRKFISQSQINGQDTVGVACRSSGGGGLGSRSQSVSVTNQTNDPHSPFSKPYFNRRGSDRSDSLTDSEMAPSCSAAATPGSGSCSSSLAGGGIHQRQSSLGQSFFDQTSTALSSFQKQSLNFFKRLDAQSAPGGGSNTPPHSAKSERSFLIHSSAAGAASGGALPSSGAPPTGAGGSLRGTAANGGFKSASMDASADYNHQYGGGGKSPRKTPPKPPPPAPQSLVNRQSSLSSYGMARGHQLPATPNSTPAQTRQNSTISAEATGPAAATSGQRNRVIRQNSALSAFEPFDPELSAAAAAAEAEQAQLSLRNRQAKDDQPEAPQPSSAKIEKPQQRSLEAATRKADGNFDSSSITSGDSNSTTETVTGEDTMNNLKKTFASIFGDKCD